MHARDFTLSSVAEPVSQRPRARGQRKRVGQILIDRGHLTRPQLRRALLKKYRSGAPLGKILLEAQDITETALTEALALQHGYEVINLDAQGPEFERLLNADAKECAKVVAIPWRLVDRTPVLVVSDPTRIKDAKRACGYEGRRVRIALSTRSQILRSIEHFFSREMERDACLTCPEHLSARNWNLAASTGLGLIVFLGTTMSALFAPALLFWTLFLSILTMNFATAIFRLSLVAARFWPEPDRPGPPRARPELGKSLPKVTLMIGLLREDLVLPQLLKHLAELDYPQELLEILLMLEDGDDITLSHLAAIDPPRPVDVITVPKGTVTTKPRALNYGLNFARGEIVGILDAEDRPHRDQIMDVVTAFDTAPSDVACVQGVLDFYNVKRNWLSRCFTIEYAIWFRVLLKGMQRLHLPIPLGGTTVYFRRDILEQTGAWDAHNVTEDADLGIRLFRYGFRTEVIPSVTLEEANAAPISWIKQRSRWIKGYMITWATHMAQPRMLLRDLGARGFLSFQFLFLGGIVSYLSIPFLWGLWIGAFGFDFQFHLGGTGGLWKVAFASMLFGQIVMLGVAAAALYKPDKRGLIPWMFTLPIYWPLGAVAGFKAFYEVFFAPYYWDKTRHGHQSDQSTENEASPSALMETEKLPGSSTG